MIIQEMIDKHFGGDRAKAAESARCSGAHLRNLISKGFEVVQMADGRFIMVTKVSKIFDPQGKG